MTAHSSILAWRIPWTEEPGRLQSMWSQRVGHWAHTCYISKSHFTGIIYTCLPFLMFPDMNNQLIRKDPHSWKDWRQEEKGTTEDEMVERHHRLNGHGFEQAPGDGEGQESLACCSSWCHKELDMTEWMKWTDHPFMIKILNIMGIEGGSTSTF